MFENIQLFFTQLSFFLGHLDPLAAFWSAAKFAAQGLLLAFIIISACARFKIFRRKNKYWNIAAKLYFIYIPIVCMGAGVSLGLLQYIKAVNDETVSVWLQPVKQEMADYLQSLPPEVSANLSLPALKTHIRIAIEQALNESPTASRLAGLINQMPAPAKTLLLEKFADVVVEKLNEKISDATRIDEKILSQLWQHNAIALIKSDLLDRVVSQKTHGLIDDYQKNSLILTLLLLLLPVADTLIARFLEQRRTPTQALASGQ
ncbi:MAG: hypothetical protein LBV49_03680 [Azonexus sp.]|jgi:hypothetical protein|nr:hypothetical protein [Azonexus sp.]